MNPAGAGILGILALVAVCTGTLGGLLLLLVGIRGRRVDDHPVCRRCGFDLVGVYGAATNAARGAGAARCPECGSDLVSAGSVRTGNRRRRRGMIVSGALLLMGAIAVGGVTGWSLATKFNWNTIKPYSLLIHDARSQDLKTTDGAATELLSRLRDGKLTEEQGTETVGLALELQADAASTWSNSWGDLLDSVQARDGLSDAQRVRYIRNGARFDFAVRVQTLEGDPIPMEMRVSGPRLGGNRSVVIWTRMTSLSIDGAPVAMKTMPSGRQAVSRSGSSSSKTSIPAGPAAGTHTVRATVIFEEHPDQADSPARLTWTQEFEARLEVLPAGASLYELIDDPAMEEKMRKCIEIQSLSRQPWGVETTLIFKDPPCPYAFELFLKAGELEIAGSVLSGNAGQQMGWGGGIDYAGAIEAQTVDVILRPSLKALKDSMDLTKAWGKEIIIKDVPLKRAED